MKNCLILDRDHEHAEALRKLCAGIPFDVIVASSLSEARDAVSEKDITIAFIDFTATRKSYGSKTPKTASLWQGNWLVLIAGRWVSSTWYWQGRS